MSNKTISINPSLFSIGGQKTKKNREKKAVVQSTKPLINPNILKTRLLKRIKEHKQRETQNIYNNSQNKQEIQVKTDDLQAYTDEFNDSINYLQTLSKQKKINDEKTNYEKQKQKRKEALERNTMKNYKNLQQSIYNSGNSSISNINNNPYVNLELPEELKIDTSHIQSNSFILNKPVKDNIPYGILKGGLKPTYRVWSKTQRNNIVTNPDLALTIQNGGLSKEKIERETRLHNLRTKLKNKQAEELKKNIIENKTNIIENKTNINKTINNESLNSETNTNIVTQPITKAVISSPIINQQIDLIVNNDCIQNRSALNIIDHNASETNIPKENIVAIKKITKKTIKKKYTLGKSKIKKAVGVLIKDRRTRKMVLNAQKDLKKKSINDIKNYLREHNLIKTGSNAPNDVIRKIYESAMLSGEITNNNGETLLHNFSKDDKKL